MGATQTIKKKVYQALDELPPESFEELLRFLDFLVVFPNRVDAILVPFFTAENAEIAEKIYESLRTL
ncbi:MAG: hypothetical protein H5T62_11600, partial [Anaerolineae bacterium]|nr:hypothetical protein [Anaerolineae bacterium]